MTGRTAPFPDTRLDRLVLEAAALDDPEAFLAGLRREDPHIAAEVERRIRAAAGLDDDFLASPASVVLAALVDEPGDGDGDAPLPPVSNERYEVGECLGAGGMARVYRAFDHQLGRPVALKVLRTGDPDTPHRLLAEARAQARVRHDHVLDVYETGELDGSPYIAVRFAAGGTLDDLPDTVGLEARVRLLAQAAEGLHAAHREGLLHGDVKPSNVLVEETGDGDLQAWIGDFGIAVELAREGERVGTSGTPRYMAPELLGPGPALGLDRRAGDGAGAGAGAGNRDGDYPQAPLPSGRRADRRADVYSLGVTLFRVVTGEAPPGAAGFAVLRAAAPGLPPDLVAVAARCMAPDPADRYPSARAVALDLRRFLDGEVVEAYADRRAYRWSRFAARHRLLLTVAGVSALLLAGALLVAAVMGLSAMRANAVAEDRRGQAEELIDFMLDDLRDKLEPVGRLDLLDDVGERAMAYFAAVPEEELSDQELARRSQALYQIADVRMDRGDLAGAERPLAESLALARELAQRDPDNPDRLFGLGQSEFWAGFAHWRRGDPAAARPHFEAYEEVSRRLVALDPQRLDWQAELSYAHSNLGSLLEAQGDLEGALEHFRLTLANDRRRVAATTDPALREEWRADLAASHNTVAVVLERLGRLEAARRHYVADLAIRRDLAAADPEHHRRREFLGTAHQYLGRLHLTRGELAAARPHLERSQRIFSELVDHDPANGDWRHKLGWSEIRLGRLEAAAGHRDEAEAAWRRAAAVARQLTADDPERTDWQRLDRIARLHPNRDDPPASPAPTDPAAP